MREPVVKQAVTFLGNPGLKSQTFEKKKAFLQGKGLTEEEILEAQRRMEAGEAAPEAPLAVAGAPAGVGATSAAALPGANPGWPAQGTAAVQPPAVAAEAAPPPHAAQVSQAVLLLRRRLAELEYERACYIAALGALGDLPVVDSAPNTAATSRLAALAAQVIAPGATSLASAGAPAPQAPPAAAPPAAAPPAARKPWEAALQQATPAQPGLPAGLPSSGLPAPPSAANSGDGAGDPPPGVAGIDGGGSLEDDPDLEEIMRPSKKSSD